MNELIEFLENQDVKYKRNFKISEFSSISIGGRVSFFVLPDSVAKLVGLLDFLTERKIRFAVVGNMTNILASDEYMDLVVVSTVDCSGFSVTDSEVYAECGVLFSRLILNAAELSLGGCESLFGIPGTVGAMLRGNAGAYGQTASDKLISVEVYDTKNRSVFSIEKDAIGFSYRDSTIKKSGLIVIGARFDFDRSDRDAIFEKIKAVRKTRAEKQPISDRSLGSVFKRDKEYPASLLIDRCGLKGMRVGGISVSQKHAGFFVNDGHGTARDFTELCDSVKREVFLKFGITLCEEVEYLN